MGILWQDLKYGIRGLLRNRGLALVAVLSLTFGIGANTAIFSLIDCLFLRKLPVRQPERLVELSTVGRDGQKSELSFPIFQETESHQRVFSGLFAWFGNVVLNVEANGTRSLGNVLMVTGNFYSELGVSPILGRYLAPEDVDLRGTFAPVAVISYGFWQRRFGSDQTVIGKQVLVESQPFTIVGVARKWFTGMGTGSEPDVTIPLTAVPTVTHGNINLGVRNSFWLSATGRLKDDVTIEQARAQMGSVWPDVLSAAAPPNITGEQKRQFLSYRIDLDFAASGVEMYLRPHFSRALLVLACSAGIILLVACVNLANLLLARASARGRELSVRIALGASRWRLVRQFLTESLLLAAAGALFGLVFAFWGSRALASFITQLSITPLTLDLNLDLRVLMLTVAMATGVGILFGLAPARLAMRYDVAGGLQHGARTLGGRNGGLGKPLIMAQVALSIVLLHGAGLMVRSIQNLRSMNTGFQKDGVLLAELFPLPDGYKDLNIDIYYRQLIERLSGLPGVVSVGWSNLRPGGGYELKDSISIASEDLVSNGSLEADYAIVSPGFFNTLGMSLIRGRDFRWADDEHNPRVVILSANLARHLFSTADAVGQYIRFGTDPIHGRLQVIGVVNDAQLFDVRKPSAEILYMPFLQESGYTQNGNLEIRASIEPKTLVDSVRSQVDVLRHEYAFRIRTLTQVCNQSILEERATAILSGFFAVVALLLASIGLYGVLSYNVTLRKREFGIRMAIGAQLGVLVGSVVRDAAWLTLSGLVIGLPFAIVIARLISTMLFGVSIYDPSTLVVSTGALLMAALVAGYLPAKRAAEVDPMVALRHD
jgi:predicted permease